jgi:hypothetical protein
MLSWSGVRQGSSGNCGEGRGLGGGGRVAENSPYQADDLAIRTQKVHATKRGVEESGACGEQLAFTTPIIRVNSVRGTGGNGRHRATFPARVTSLRSTDEWDGLGRFWVRLPRVFSTWARRTFARSCAQVHRRKGGRGSRSTFCAGQATLELLPNKRTSVQDFLRDSSFPAEIFIRNAPSSLPPLYSSLRPGPASRTSQLVPTISLYFNSSIYTIYIPRCSSDNHEYNYGDGWLYLP